MLKLQTWATVAIRGSKGLRFLVNWEWFLIKSGLPSKETYFLTFAMTYWTLFKINKIRDINGGRGGREGGVYGAKRSGKEKNMYHGSSTGVWHHSGLLHQAVLGLHMGERLETFGERGGEAEWCKEQPWEESKSSTTTFTADSALGRLWKSSWRKGKKHPMEEQVYSFFPRSDPGDQLVSSFRVLVSKGFGHLGYRHHTCGRNSSSHTTDGSSSQELLWSSISRWRSA